MSIEARGARYAYAYSGVSLLRSIQGSEVTNHVRHTLGFLAADGEDEAYGIAMRAMRKLYPPGYGWQHHDVQLKRIDDADWIGRLDLDTIERVEV
jgi:hypothetical protein